MIHEPPHGHPDHDCERWNEQLIDELIEELYPTGGTRIAGIIVVQGSGAAHDVLRPNDGKLRGYLAQQARNANKARYRWN